ncbi:MULTISPECIES: HAMP domain-containing sensor histidine kinase [unclassified Halorubrum]|uniref:sensor histidine kinase n=1 Tax=unclassified Halorubrum TaxID=2642239 RepID=UPI000B97D377|nr:MULTISPECIES: HAMP domain-containing sensor histidine kinase [unclassified Halorubrum]OYR43979.1 two-component sensor histidine kinase [Halorubrum sp. Eb13]OYR51343.1 two-component sensor histidine kinase [Halorubrum sp. Ea1]
MSDDRHTAIPLREFPDPALAYTVDGDDARVTATNDAFEQQFEQELVGGRVSTIFDRFNSYNTTGDREPVSHLVRGDRIGIRLDGYGNRGPFFARVIPSDDDTGYLVFTDLRECPDEGYSPGVDQVSSVISHDLRNPLDVAKAHLRAAQETGDPEHFESVADAHDRMERIIRDVLTLTRDDAVVQPTEEVAIETAARDAWESIDTEQVELTVSESLPTVTADPDRLQRLFENLFRNSVEHGVATDETGNDQPTKAPTKGRSNGRDGQTSESTTVAVHPFEGGFYIADDGPGIPSTEREIVFTPGYSTRSGGTGLGLAIVDRIVEAHGWDLTLTAADDGGARFEISH